MSGNVLLNMWWHFNRTFNRHFPSNFHTQLPSSSSHFLIAGGFSLSLLLRPQRKHRPIIFKLQGQTTFQRGPILGYYLRFPILLHFPFLSLFSFNYHHIHGITVISFQCTDYSKSPTKKAAIRVYDYNWRLQTNGAITPCKSSQTDGNEKLCYNKRCLVTFFPTIYFIQTEPP